MCAQIHSCFRASVRGWYDENCPGKQRGKSETKNLVCRINFPATKSTSSAKCLVRNHYHRVLETPTRTSSPQVYPSAADGAIRTPNASCPLKVRFTWGPRAFRRGSGRNQYIAHRWFDDNESQSSFCLASAPPFRPRSRAAPRTHSPTRPPSIPGGR